MSHQEPYTKFPNLYTDTIKPRLTGTQKAICDVVIRLTTGWHQETAAISTTEFVEKSGRARSGIIEAKKELIAIGLLVEVYHGIGTRSSRWKLNLRYDRAQSDATEATPEPAPAPEPVAVEEAPQEAVSEAVECPVVDTQPESVPAVAETAASSPEIGLPLSIVRSKDKERIQTEATAEVDSDQAPVEKKGVATGVCFQFQQLFPKAKAADDWKFFGWATTKHSVEACIAQLEYGGFCISPSRINLGLVIE